MPAVFPSMLELWKKGTNSGDTLFFLGGGLRFFGFFSFF